MIIRTIDLRNDKQKVLKRKILIIISNMQIPYYALS